MFSDKLGDYFEGVAAKYLSAVDANRTRSNQHEIGGLPAAGFRKWLGTPGKSEVKTFKAHQVYIRDEDAAALTCESHVTWYDSRRNSPHRSPEYRLYYVNSPVIEQISEGDFFLIAKLRDNSLLMVFTPGGSTIERQLRVLFGLSHIDDTFTPGSIDAIDFLLPLRFLLEDLGIDLGRSEDSDQNWLEQLTKQFGGTEFPGTAAFSAFARTSLRQEVDAIVDPDDALLDWLSHEEKLFRIYERHLVEKQLENGFGKKGNDVDEFISFSLSVQNRRKSRVGHAFEHHLNHLFELHNLHFEQGRGKGRCTENNSKPDFMFPSFSAYHDHSFPEHKLIMLGAKTSCKDRWRQVLSEANRIRRKHLITIEAAISPTQTEEMKSHNLQLVIPRRVQSTYLSSQIDYLINVGEFISEAKAAS